MMREGKSSSPLRSPLVLYKLKNAIAVKSYCSFLCRGRRWLANCGFMLS